MSSLLSPNGPRVHHENIHEKDAEIEDVVELPVSKDKIEDVRQIVRPMIPL